MMRPISARRVLAAALSLCLTCSLLPGTAAAKADAQPDSAKVVKTQLGFAAGGLTKNDGTVTLKVAYADDKGVHQEDITPTGMTETDIALLDTGSDFDPGLKAGTTVELCLDGKGNVVNIKKVYDNGLFFDTMKYGAELSPVDGKVGAMLANGWLTEKKGNQITVGDLDRFQETYTLASNVKVYEYDTEKNTVTKRSLADVPVTEKTEGEFYLTDHRQQVIAVFDRSYQDAEKAKVVELYYVTPQPTIDAKYLYPSDHMPIDSFLTENDGKTVGKPNGAVWLTAAEPFAIIPDRLYYVGDNEVAIYLLKTDDGKLVMLDAGWPPSGYLYWQNIEEMGFDPRDVDYLLLTHGHGDHYGTAAELDTMIKNSGGDPVIYECYEDMHGYDIYGFPEIPGIINNAAIFECVDELYQHETWMEFEGFRLKTVLTPGHSIGTCSVIFEMTDPATGELLNMAYLGGYGVNGNTKYDPDNGKGYLRLSFQYGLRYLQQTVDPDYILPQHTNQYPMLEIEKAAKAKGLSFMEAMNRGAYEWVNFLEKRQAVITYEDYYQQWKADPKDEFGTDITVTDKDLQTIEAVGPYRREAGTYEITLTDGGKIIQGFDRYMNKNEKLKGVVSEAGNDVGDGIFILKDSFTHDPDAWYVQVGAHVKDGYDGSVAGGPIEAVHKDWFEVIRTERLGSKAEAEALLAKLQSGATYTVTLDQSSEIQLADDLADTFQPATTATGSSDVAADAWYAQAVGFVTDKGLFTGVPGGKFDPNGTMDRAMLATVLQRMAGGKDAAASFADVPANAWYAQAVGWASASGVMNGSSATTFAPNMTVTREQLAATLYRYAQLQGVKTDAAASLAAFPDANQVSGWAKEAMAWAVGAGVISGTGAGTLAPQASASRAEVAAVLQRCDKLLSGAGAQAGKLTATPIASAVTETVKVDSKHPLDTTLSGLYSVDVEMDGGKTRPLYWYVPDSVGYRQPAVAIGVPSGADAADFMVSTGWKAVADDRGICLVLMTADKGGWAKDESAYTAGVFQFLDDRTYLQMQDSAYYMVGYGDAADTVMAFAVGNAEKLSGFAAFGVDDFDTTLLAAAQKAESNAKGVMKSEVSVPMWLGADSKTSSVTALTDYWKKANDCGDEALSSRYADEIYQPVEYLADTNEITYDDCSKVLVTLGLNETQTPAFTQYLYNDFLMRTRRQDSGDINALRPFATNEEKGMEYHTMEVNGLTREFWVYVPQAVKSGKAERVPLVFAFHGGGGSGEEFAGRSGWDKVAEERNFIAVFPTGSRGNQNFCARTTWAPSDLDFVGQMRTFLLKNYSVDESRIYVSGQSMGCIMSFNIALVHPEWIAACAAASAPLLPSATENVDTSLIMPMMWSVGDKDQHFQKEEGGLDTTKITSLIDEWRARYGITANESNTFTYQNGNFHGYDFKNVDGVTLIREQMVTDKIHAMLPDEVYTLYDFMSAYSRGADGTAYYMGVEISPKTK